MRQNARVGCDCSYTTKASIERLLAPLQVPVSVGGISNRLFSAFLTVSIGSFNVCLTNYVVRTKKDLFGRVVNAKRAPPGTERTHRQ